MLGDVGEGGRCVPSHWHQAMTMLTGTFRTLLDEGMSGPFLLIDGGLDVLPRCVAWLLGGN